MSTDVTAGGLSVDGKVVPRALVPDTVEELRDTVTASDGPVLIVGGGTRLAFGNLGGPFEIAVSTRGLNRVLHYEPADLTVAVEPGMIVTELSRVLGEKNQMLPIDCPNPDRSTVGGIFASGLGGPRRLRYGSMRDWVLGIEVMDSSGVVTKSGGMVVKNVTGYDLARVHYSAQGAFGIVTRLNLKVLPGVESERSVILSYPSARSAHAAGTAVLASQLEPVSILVSRDEGWQLAVRCEGPHASIDWQSQAVVDAASSRATPESVSVLENGAAAIAPYLAVTDTGGALAIARISAPPSRQVDVLERYQRLVGSLLCADLGSGLVYVSGPPSLEWREALRQSHQNPVFLSLPPELKSGIDVYGETDTPNARLVMSLKDSYDPLRRFNRGRFVLGL